MHATKVVACQHVEDVLNTQLWTLVKFMLNWASIVIQGRVDTPERTNEMLTSERQDWTQMSVDCGQSPWNDAWLMMVFMVLKMARGRNGATSCFIFTPKKRENSSLFLWKNKVFVLFALPQNQGDAWKTIKRLGPAIMQSVAGKPNAVLLKRKTSRPFSRGSLILQCRYEFSWVGSAADEDWKTRKAPSFGLFTKLMPKDLVLFFTSTLWQAFFLFAIQLKIYRFEQTPTTPQKFPTKSPRHTSPFGWNLSWAKRLVRGPMQPFFDSLRNSSHPTNHTVAVAFVRQKENLNSF